ncbi:MAG: histone [Chthoniobacteraceae bacterium]
MSNTPTLSQLQRGLQLAEKIAALEAEMAAIFGGAPSPKAASTKVPEVKKKGGMSPAGRERIAAAQRARWAKIKKGKAPAVKAVAPASKAAAPKAAKKKRTMSPAVRAKLAAAMKARWAAAKAGKGPAPTAGKKK